MANIPTTWDAYTRQYQALVNNISTALNQNFGYDKAANGSINKAEFSAAIDNIINSDAKIQQQFKDLLTNASKMISQMNVPRADGFTNEQLNQQKGAEVSNQQRKVPEWAKSLMDNAPPGESPLIQDTSPNASAQNNAENRAENRKKLTLTPGKDLKLQNAPKLTAALKKDLEVQYTPKMKPSPL